MAGGGAGRWLSEREFVWQAGVHAVRVRWAIVLPIQAAALLVMPPDRLRAATVALAVTAVWALVMLLAPRPAATWVLVADLAVVSGICLAQPWIEVPALVGAQCGWVPFAVEAIVIIYQVQFPDRGAVTGPLVLALAYAAGALMMTEQTVFATVVFTGWILLTAVLARWLVTQLRLGARGADEAAAAADRAQREVQVAEARRRSEAEHLSTLHDTVAATLMMVGLGVATDHGALQQQAVRDLDVLSGSTWVITQDLEGALREAAAASGVEVDLVASGPVEPLLPAVAGALTGAVGEALRNVARHSGTTHARLRLDRTAGAVEVEVRDRGRGFDAGSGQGRGIRLSIVERMALCGGAAVLESSPRGVTVRLTWPAEQPR